MSNLEMSTPELGGPAAWRDLLYGFVAAQGSAHVCERRRALFDATCEPGDLDESRAAIAALAATVTLVPSYADGVPVDADGRMLRPPSVFVLWNGVPVGDVPVMIESQRIDAQVSDAAGRVAPDLAVGTRMPGTAQARIDADTLLGPLVLGVARRRGPSRARTVATIADDARGAVDYVVLGDLQSAFASRMGGIRVWFEARGRLEVFEAWSETSVVSVEAKERASGVGDARADEAARAKLIAALVALLAERPDLRWPNP